MPAQKNHPMGGESPQGFSPRLSWSHYRTLMRVENIEARDFYERETIAGGWHKRTLERQIHSYYYERILKSRKPAKMLAEGRRLPREWGCLMLGPRRCFVTVKALQRLYAVLLCQVPGTCLLPFRHIP